VICCQNRFDPQAFETFPGVQEIVDRGILERHLLDFHVRLFVSVVSHSRPRDQRQAVVSPVVRDKGKARRRASLHLPRRLKIRRHPEHPGIPVKHLLLVRSHQAEVV